MPGTNRLLVVDDDKEIANYIATVARSCGYLAAAANSYEACIDKLAVANPTVVLLDMQMSGRDPIEYLNAMAEQECNAKIVLVSDTEDRSLQTATQLGKLIGLDIRNPMSKPFSVYTLRRRLSKLVTSDNSITGTELKRAIDSGQIRPHFQPIVTVDDGTSGNVCGVEALARWYRNDTDLLLPASFIAQIEDEGLMRYFTESIVYQVATQLKEWSRQGQDLNGSINLSSSILTDRYMPDRLEEIVQNVGIENDRITFEATEELVLEHTVETLEILSRLRAKGFGLSIDDFGTGFSSLQKLYEMPFNELKVDMSFTKACEKSAEARIIIEATVELGHKLGLKVCAEGVETECATEYLREIGCDRMQGYYFGKPRAGMDMFRQAASHVRPVEFSGQATGLESPQPCY